jgi:HSP20 family molecular chaperone IbpA
LQWLDAPFGLGDTFALDFDDDDAGQILVELSSQEQRDRDAKRASDDINVEPDGASPSKAARTDGHDGPVDVAVSVDAVAPAVVATAAVAVVPEDVASARAQRFADQMRSKSTTQKDTGVHDFAANYLIAQPDEAIIALHLPWPSGTKRERHVPGVVSEFLYAHYFLTRDAAGEPVAPYRAFVAAVRATFHLPASVDKRAPYSRAVNVAAASLAPLLDFSCPFGGHVPYEELDELLTAIASTDAQCRLNCIKGVSFKRGCILPRPAFDLVKAWRRSCSSKPPSASKPKLGGSASLLGDAARVDQVVTSSAVLLRVALPGCELTDVLVTRKDSTVHIYVGAHVESLKANLRNQMEWSAAVAALPSGAVRAEASAFAEAVRHIEPKPQSYFRFTGEFAVALNVKTERLQKQKPAVSLVNGVLTITLAFRDKENASKQYYF